MSGRGPVRLCVIVPVRNETEHIVPCVKSILADEPPGGIDVIVVDGDSDDGTAARVTAAFGGDPRVRLLRNPSCFVPQALNIGIAASSAPFVGRIDGHCRVEPGYFAGCLVRLDATGADCVGGALINEGRGPSGRAVAAAQSSPVGVGNASFRTGMGCERRVDTLAFGVYRREVFDRIGLFDEQFVRNQDDEFNLRLVRAGGTILLAPSLRIRYFVRESIWLLGRQYHQYGYWKFRVFRKHGRPGSLRQLVPSLFVLALTAALLTAVVTFWVHPFLTAIALPYALICLGEGVRWRLRTGAPITRTVLALASMHVAYGTGVLRALWDHLRGRRAPASFASRLSR